MAVSSSSSSTEAAVCDTQYGLLQLQARGPYGLSQGLLNSNGSSAVTAAAAAAAAAGSSVDEFVAQLLRVSGYGVNPLDYSTAWQLLQVLQAVGALPQRPKECEELQSMIGMMIMTMLMMTMTMLMMMMMMVMTVVMMMMMVVFPPVCNTVVGSSTVGSRQAGSMPV
jgi:hypothetical protein